MLFSCCAVLYLCCVISFAVLTNTKWFSIEKWACKQNPQTWMTDALPPHHPDTLGLFVSSFVHIHKWLSKMIMGIHVCLLWDGFPTLKHSFKCITFSAKLPLWTFSFSVYFLKCFSFGFTSWFQSLLLSYNTSKIHLHVYPTVIDKVSEIKPWKVIFSGGKNSRVVATLNILILTFNHSQMLLWITNVSFVFTLCHNAPPLHFHFVSLLFHSV